MDLFVKVSPVNVIWPRLHLCYKLGVLPSVCKFVMLEKRGPPCSISRLGGYIAGGSCPLLTVIKAPLWRSPRGLRPSLFSWIPSGSCPNFPKGANWVISRAPRGLNSARSSLCVPIPVPSDILFSTMLSFRLSLDVPCFSCFSSWILVTFVSGRW